MGRGVPTPNSDRTIFTSDNPFIFTQDGDLWWCTKMSPVDSLVVVDCISTLLMKTIQGSNGLASPNVGFGGGNGGYDVSYI